MKYLFTLLVTSVIATGAFAQAPEKMSYQAVIRTATNALLDNQTVGMQISILQDSVAGPSVYTETHTPLTNINGLATIEIGNGTPSLGAFNTIDWSSGPYFVRTETDPTGGTAYTISGTSQLISVPYALHAKTAESITGGISETDPVFGASIASGITAVDTANWNDHTIDTQIDSIGIANLGFVTISPVVIFSDTDNDTKMQLEESFDEDIIRFDLGGVEYFTMDSGRLEVFNTGNSVFLGAGAGRNDDFTDNQNTAIGDSALSANTIGYLNTAIGFGALSSNTDGTHNSAGGALALYSNTTGVTNTAFGTEALTSNTTGYGNHAFGYGTLSSNTSGVRCIAIGSTALYSNTTGNGNNAIGFSVLNHNLDGSDNTALGFEAMHFNLHGSGNTGVGNKALNLNEDGSRNTAVGENALLSNDFGNFNTAVGTLALFANAGGNNNTAIGYYANFTSTASAYSNSSAVGYISAVTASNQIRLGNSSVTSIGGFAGWSILSDGRFKENVQENVPGLDFISQLRPVTYNLDVEKLNGFLGVPDSLVDEHSLA
ncbi:MAG: hypothetical protein ACI865_003021, partial [Flavobacteriaceae bacterium]